MPHSMRRLLAVLISVAVLLAPQLTLAAGERYEWGDSTKGSILARDGSYAQPVTYIIDRSASTPERVVFRPQTGTVQLECVPGGTYQWQTQITLDSASYQREGDVRGSVSTPAGATATACTPSGGDRQGLDPNPTIAKGSGVPAPGTAAAAAAAPAPDDESCDQGGATWLVCPFLNNLSNLIAGIARDVIEPFLRVDAISKDNTPQIYNAWENVKNFSLILFVLVFMAIIYSTVTTGFFDQYNVRKMLPRLVISVILVHFSFLISALIVDFGNVLGQGIDELVRGAIRPGEDQADGIHIFTNLIGFTALGLAGLAGVAGAGFVLGSWLAIAPLLVSIFLALLIVMLIFAARYIAIALLIVLSPLAFVAWVLPNTQSYFSKWWTALTRLVMMYPIIMFIITLTGSVSELIGDRGAEAAAGAVPSAMTTLMKPLLIIATLLLIPLTFKWAAGALGTIVNTLQGMRQRSVKSYQGSTMAERGRAVRKERQAEAMRRLYNSERYARVQKGQMLGGKAEKVLGKRGASSLGRTGNFLATRGWAMALGGAPNDPRDLSAMQSRQQIGLKKELDDLTDANNPFNLTQALTSIYSTDKGERDKARDYLRTNAPTLLRYTTTQAGRMALFAKAADSGAVNDKLMELVRNGRERDLYPSGITRGENTVTRNLSNEYAMAMAAAGKERKEKKLILMRLNEDKTNYEVKDESGNVIYSQPHRHVGQVDIEKVMVDFRNTTAYGLNEKFDGQNLEVMFDYKDKGKFQRQAGDDAAFAMAHGLMASAVNGSFDPTSRNAMPVEKKIGFYKAFKANTQHFSKGRGYDEVLKPALKQLEKDTSLQRSLAKVAGIPEYIIEPNIAAGRPQDNVAYFEDWVKRPVPLPPATKP